jgi:hypothetical protein
MKYSTKTLPDPRGLIRPHVAPTSGFFFMLRSNSFKAVESGVKYYKSKHKPIAFRRSENCMSSL